MSVPRVHDNRVRVSSTTSGTTSTFVLGGAKTVEWQAVPSSWDGEAVVWLIEHDEQPELELIKAVYTLGTSSIERDVNNLIFGTSGGSLVPFSAGNKTVSAVLRTRDLVPREFTLPFADPIDWDAAEDEIALVTLTGDTTINATVLPPNGSAARLVLVMGGSGGHAVTWGTGFDATTLGRLNLWPMADAVTVVPLVVSGGVFYLGGGDTAMPLLIGEAPIITNPASPYIYDVAAHGGVLSIKGLDHHLTIEATNIPLGLRGAITVQQDATVGGWQITWGSGFDATSFGRVVTRTSANSVTSLMYVARTGATEVLLYAASQQDDNDINSTVSPTNLSFGSAGPTMKGFEQGTDTALGLRHIKGQALNMLDTTLQRPLFQDYAETLVPVAVVAGAITCNMEAGNLFDVALTANVTVPVLPINAPITGRGGTATLVFTQDGTGGWTVAWSTAITWLGGSAPTIDPAPSAPSVVTLLTRDGGTTWLGFSGTASGLSTVLATAMATLRPQRGGAIGATLDDTADGKLLHVAATGTTTVSALEDNFSCTITNPPGSGFTRTIAGATSGSVVAGEVASLMKVDGVYYLPKGVG